MMTTVAYFTAEIGLWSELHTYSGGLGVLAGDHIKAAADANLPLVGMTLLYREGYSRQELDKDGVQSETYPRIDPDDHLIDTGVSIALPLDGATLHAHVWKAEVPGVQGHRVPVYFLDTHHDGNSEAFAHLGARLYGGDDAMRVRQEYLLGVGGVRALQQLGHDVAGLHLNEGHCTFAMLEMLGQGWSREELKQRTLFTTHTPVPAGHDRFAWELVEQVVGELLPDDAQQLVRDAGDPEAGRRCSMSHLAVALVSSVNAVSHLNAKVASGMFGNRHIAPLTNGVHHITWTSSPMQALFDEHLTGWRSDPSLLGSAESLPSRALKKARQDSRKALREMVKSSTGVLLDEKRLTIGFARRFATYKRANLVFSDLQRLRKIGAHRVQFVFSGKAHPKDEGGKQLIRDIFASAAEIADEIPVAFIENYDMNTGRAMTSGVDIWLNNPIRPLEASGTSGMKAAMNGVPNCSILDGWWPEACEHGVNGWAIGEADDERNDARDAENIYRVLETAVLPLWEQDPDGWSAMMRASIATSAGFTGSRMIAEYQEFYEKFS